MRTGPDSERGDGFRGQAMVVVEYEPNRFMAFQLSGVDCVVELDQEVEDVWGWEPLSVIRPVSTRARIELQGFVVSQDQPSSRPSWAEPAQGEVGARRELPAAP